jgi:large subunit ribosomal protein L4
MNKKTNTIKIPVIDLKGKVVSELDSASDLFGVEPNEAVLHFVCEGQRFRFYKKTAKTKTRSAVSGTSKKSVKQKGSGGARHGNRRAPIFVGGGIAFGPTGIKRNFKVNKKVRKIAMASVLSDRYSGGLIRILKADISAPKTKTVEALLSGLELSNAKVGFVVSRANDQILGKSARNLKNVMVLSEEKWTPLDFVKTDSLIFSEKAFGELVSRYTA